jgi:DNA-binding transcriptional MocR family regulator
VAARERGIAYANGEPFRVESAGPPALLLSFAALSPDEIRTGIAELAALARASARNRRPAPAHGASRRRR